MDKQVQVFIFRHGETDWNVEKRFQGHTDVPLNENGRIQAAKLKTVAKKIMVELVLSSDLLRAAETAKLAFGDLGTSIQLCSELREAFLGEPEGWVLSEVIDKYGKETWETWISNSGEHQDFSFPGGETKRAHLNRVLTFLDSTLSQGGFERVAVSTHGGVIRRLVHHAKQSPKELVSISNCKVHELLFECGQWTYIRSVD